MPAQPDRALIRALAEVVVVEEKARTAADSEITAELAQLRERIAECDASIELKVAAATADLRKGDDDAPPPPPPVAVDVPAVVDEALVLPPELAEQVAVAVRMLHEESPPVAQHAPVKQQVVIGPQGEPGAPGRDGKDGPPGRDGISVVAAAINRSGELMLTLSDGMVLTPGCVVGRDAAA